MNLERTVIELDDHLNFVIALPENLLIDLQWFENQKLTLEITEDGSLIISKLVEKVSRPEEPEIYV